MGDTNSWLSTLLRNASRVKVPSSAVFAETGRVSQEVPTSEVKLSRSLGPWDLILLGIGASIGSGIFVVTGIAARDTGPGKVSNKL